SVDTTFGTSGIRVEQWDLISNGEDFADSMALARDGGILLAGGISISPGDHRPALARLTPGGDLDPSFAGGTGVFVAQTNVNAWFPAVDTRVVDSWIDLVSYSPAVPYLKGAVAFEVDAVGGNYGASLAKLAWDGSSANLATRVRYEGDGKTYVAGYYDDN